MRNLLFVLLLSACGEEFSEHVDAGHHPDAAPPCNAAGTWILSATYDPGGCNLSGTYSNTAFITKTSAGYTILFSMMHASEIVSGTVSGRADGACEVSLTDTLPVPPVTYISTMNVTEQNTRVQGIGTLTMSNSQTGAQCSQTFHVIGTKN